MSEKMKISLPIIVEGRYDKSTLSGFVSADIIATDGFAVFNNKEKQALIRRISKNGVIVLTDSDGGGKQIRSFLSGIVPKDKLHHLFIPKIEGKERRKPHPSRAGTLGVEGMKKELLLSLLSPFASASDRKKDGKMITKLDFFEDGLSGTDNSSERRAALCRELDLPDDMTANALLGALNLLLSYEEYKKIAERLRK